MRTIKVGSDPIFAYIQNKDGGLDVCQIVAVSSPAIDGEELVAAFLRGFKFCANEGAEVKQPEPAPVPIADTCQSHGCRATSIRLTGEDLWVSWCEGNGWNYTREGFNLLTTATKTNYENQAKIVNKRLHAA